MALPPVSGSSSFVPSKKADKPKKVGSEEPKVKEVASRMSISPGRPVPIKEHVIQQTPPQEHGRPIGDTGINLPSSPVKRSRGREPLPSEKIQGHGLPKTPVADGGQLVHDNHLQELGLLGQMPQELLDQVIYKLPTRSNHDLDECFKQMKIFWKTPAGTPADQMIFSTIDVKKFARWVEVNKIDITNLNSLSPEDFKTCLPHLESLDLSSSRFAQFNLLETCQNMKHLNLSGRHELTDADLEHIAKITGLKSLDLGEGCYQLTDAGIEHLATKLTGLTSLNLSYCTALTDAGVESIAKLTGLTSLNIRGCDKLTVASAEHLTKLTGLISIDPPRSYENRAVAEHLVTKLPLLNPESHFRLGL